MTDIRIKDKKTGDIFNVAWDKDTPPNKDDVNQLIMNHRSSKTEFPAVKVDEVKNPVARDIVEGGIEGIATKGLGIPEEAFEENAGKRIFNIGRHIIPGLAMYPEEKVPDVAPPPEKSWKDIAIEAGSFPGSPLPGIMGAHRELTRPDIGTKEGLLRAATQLIPVIGPSMVEAGTDIGEGLGTGDVRRAAKGVGGAAGIAGSMVGMKRGVDKVIESVKPKPETPSGYTISLKPTREHFNEIRADIVKEHFKDEAPTITPPKNGLTHPEIPPITTFNKLEEAHVSSLVNAGVDESTARSIVKNMPEPRTPELSPEAKALEAKTPTPEPSATEIKPPENPPPPTVNSPSEPPPPTPEDSLAKIRRGINRAGPVRKLTEEYYTAERGRRFGEVAANMETPEGQETYFKNLRALKGELPKPDFAPLEEITQEDIQNLFNMVAETDKLGADRLGIRRHTTMKALAKLLDEEGGRVPQESELKLLRKVFGDGLVDDIMKKQSTGQKVLSGIAEGVNIPKSLMSSFDMSAPLRQGAVLGAGHPITFTKNFIKMHKMFFSKEAFLDSEAEIANRPNAHLYEQYKLDLPTLGEEERFLSKSVRKLWHVRAADQAYTGFLNRMRADVFDSIHGRLANLGEANGRNLSSLAEYINNATGRGKLPFGAEESSRMIKFLNGIAFSPRFQTSRLALLNPIEYAKMPAVVRKEAIKNMIAFTGINLTVLGLAKTAGLNVELDPRSSNFGKAQLGGKTWVDVTAGLGPWTRFLVQEALAEKKTESGKVVKMEGKGPYGATRLSTLGDFATTKESPAVALVHTLLRGKEFGDKPITFGLDTKDAKSFVGSIPDNSIAQRVTPLFVQDTISATKDLGPKGLLFAPFNFYGAGEITKDYARKPRKSVFPNIFPPMHANAN